MIRWWWWYDDKKLWRRRVRWKTLRSFLTSSSLPTMRLGGTSPDWWRFTLCYYYYYFFFITIHLELFETERIVISLIKVSCDSDKLFFRYWTTIDRHLTHMPFPLWFSKVVLRTLKNWWKPGLTLIQRRRSAVPWESVMTVLSLEYLSTCR